MKYINNSDYIFECEVKCSGLNATEVESELKKTINSFVMLYLFPYTSSSCILCILKKFRL